MKKSLIYNLTDKVLLLSSSQFHKKNFDLITTALLKNNYSLIDFINKHIKKRIKCTLNSNRECENFEDPISNYRMVSPYTKNINPKIKGLLRKHNISLLNNINNHINKNIIQLGKDELHPLDDRSKWLLRPCKNV